MDVKYVRCSNCSCVYDQELKECPRCKEPYIISEDFEDSGPIFNLCD